jgi:hypothetical protein
MSKRRPWSFTDIIALTVVTAMAFYSLSCATKCEENQVQIQNSCVGEEGAACPDGYDSSCLDELVCEEHENVLKCVPQYTSEAITNGGFRIKTGITGESGLLYFPDDQTGESVIIETEKNTTVTFWDGDGFEGFQANNTNFTPFMHVFDHNSYHKLVLETVSAGCKLISGTDNDDSKNAARNFLDNLPYASTSTTGPGCVTRNSLNEAIDAQTIAVIDLSGYIPKAGDLVKPILICAKKALIDLPQSVLESYIDGYATSCPAYQTWTAHPADLVSGVGNISPILGISGCLENIPEEIPGNGVDDDCDQRIDETIDGCVSESFSTTCRDGNVVTIGYECGDEETQPCDVGCETDGGLAYCIDDFTGSCDTTATPSSECSTSSCILYDDFDNLACFWETDDDVSVSSGNLSLDSGQEVETLLIDEGICYTSTFEVRSKLNRTDKFYDLDLGPAYVFYDGSSSPGQLGVGCDLELPEMFNIPDVRSWNTVKLDIGEDELVVLINGAYRGSFDCSESASMAYVSMRAGSATNTTLDVDYVEVKCND